MSLLAALRLPPPRAVANASPPADLRTARSRLTLERDKARATLVKLDGVHDALDRRIAAATGAAKQELLAAKASFEKQKTEAVATIERAGADLEALANPATRHDEVVKILARNGAKGSRATEVDLSQQGLKTPTPRNHDVTTTTASLDHGTSTMTKARSQRKTGLRGSTATESKETERQHGDTVVRSSEEKTSTWSTTGKQSTNERRSASVTLADGRTASVEASRSTETTLKGRTTTKTRKATALDGSSRETKTSRGVERGDGRVTATASRAETSVDAKGTERTREASASGGIVAGKDGTGAHAGVEGGRTATSKGGRQAGLVGGLHANVVCRIGDPSGEPKRWPVTLTVTFGVSVAASGGAGKKEGSKASADVEVKVGAEKSMTVTHMLDEKELGGYVKALEAASKGSKVAATYAEFAVVTAGVQKNWDVARQVWKGQAVSKQTADGLVHAGDSVETGTATTAGVAARGKVGPIGAGYGRSETDERSQKMTRNEKGNLDGDGKGAHTSQTSLSGSLSVGVAGLDVGTTHTHKTTFGFAIEIDQKDDPKGEMLAALGKCEVEVQYRIFLATHPKARFVSLTKGTADADATDMGISLGGKKVVSLGTHQGVDSSITTDAKGKVMRRSDAGHAGAGGDFLGMADSVSEDAVAESDDEGNASLTLTSTSRDNHGSRSRRKMLDKLRGSKDKSATGVLATLAGGGGDTEVVDKSGLQLGTEDLKRIGSTACTNMASWNGLARRYQENADWQKAGHAIAKAKGDPAVVASELAKFVGGDRVERLKTLTQAFRGGWHQTAGHAFEFPDSIGDLQDDYLRVTDARLAEKMDTLANKKGDPAAAEECRRLVAMIDKMLPRIEGCTEFDNPQTKREMVQYVERNRAMLVQGIRGYGQGDVHPEDDPKILAEEGDRLIRQCSAYLAEQVMYIQRVNAADLYTVSERADARKIVRQLDEMQHRWWDDYHRLQDNYTKRKLTLPDMSTLRPDEKVLEILEKKVGA